MRENMKLKTERNNLWAQTWNNFVRSFTCSTIVADIIDHLPWIYSSFFRPDWTFCYFWSHLRSYFDQKLIKGRKTSSNRMWYYLSMIMSRR